MANIFGSDKILELLLNTTAITDLLDTYVGEPAIWFDTIVPTKYKGNKCINFYSSVPVNGALEYGDYIHTINCRMPKHNDVLQLQKTVFDTFNRHNTLTGRGLFLGKAFPVIPPTDEMDLYNAPIEIKLKTIL